MTSRTACLESDGERAVWAHAVPELMSDEEDGIVDGRAVWIVSSPPERDEELSALCQVLQERKDNRRDPRSLHHHRVRRDTLAQNSSFLALLHSN